MSDSFHHKLLAMALGLSLVSASSITFAGGDRLECEDELLTEDASMDARFESDRGRDKFSASFEAAQDSSFAAGNVLQVTVDPVGASPVEVGAITLEVLPNGDLGGDLNFDTTAGPEDNDSPFPADFPAVGAGTIVKVGSTLQCDLQF